MKKSRLQVLLIILSIGLFSACERNDDEPLLPKTSISRLYVSFSDIRTDDLEDPYRNIAVFDPSDAESVLAPFEYNSGVTGGAGVYFEPSAGKVFQGSFSNQSIRTLSVNSQGSVGTGTVFRDSTLLSQRDLVYDKSSRNLYVSDNLARSISVYAQALNRNGEVRATKKFELSGQPWGMHFQGDTTQGDSLFVVIAGSAREVQLLVNPSKIDSGVVNANKKITINGASDLRGIAFSERLNTLVLTDFGSNRIYIIENAREAFNTGGVVTPTRTITGVETQLHTPIDVAIDDRDEKMLIYVINRAEPVAERENRKLLRFKTTDNGNAAPNASYPLALTPVAIFLDVR